MSSELKIFIIRVLEDELSRLEGFIALGNEIPRYKKYKKLLEEVKNIRVS